MRTQTKFTQENITPEDALNLLKQGNIRFEQNVRSLRDLKSQVDETKEGQYPFAAVLSCIDSRVPAELVFDQGIGDLFSVRIAGNIVNEDILGSLEYSCKVAGSKVIVVMGHSKCGAVTAACNGVELGNITALLNKITAAKAVKGSNAPVSDESIEAVSHENVKTSVNRILDESPILKEMVKNNEIKIVGAMYNVANGNVAFMD
ncbi:MAG: carbonic anhydrase [Crocinitomicaceae bacterium]|jgi:carbonic anhydrase